MEKKKSKYQVVVSTDATKMIVEHVTFLANVNKSAADTLKKDLWKKINVLRQTPHLYPVFVSLKLKIEFRKVTFKRYSILYAIDEPAKLIQVLYIWDARRNNEI